MFVEGISLSRLKIERKSNKKRSVLKMNNFISLVTYAQWKCSGFFMPAVLYAMYIDTYVDPDMNNHWDLLLQQQYMKMSLLYLPFHSTLLNHMTEIVEGKRELFMTILRRQVSIVFLSK